MTVFPLRPHLRDDRLFLTQHGALVDSVLVLNADFSLLEVVHWQKAVSMIFRDQVRVVEEYSGRLLRSASSSMAFPAVVARVDFVQPRKRVRFSRKNILCRDAYTCQYCGVQPRKKTGSPLIEELTIDHVVPRSHSRDGWVRLPWNGKQVRVTSWENILTACISCNSDKADRTPAQAGMHMKKLPKSPSTVDIAWMSLHRYEIPEEWQLYLPEGASEWKEYWSVELEES